MKFSLANITQVVRLVKELEVGLTKLTFSENFESFEATVIIPPATVKSIRNELKSIPTKRIILKQNVEANISDSATIWTSDFVYLENHHATNIVTLKVEFFK